MEKFTSLSQLQVVFKHRTEMPQTFVNNVSQTFTYLLLSPYILPNKKRWKIFETHSSNVSHLNFFVKLIPAKWKWQNRHFWQIFFNYKFLCAKIVANTNKKIWWRQKLELKKNKLFSLIWWLSMALQTVIKCG